MNIDELITGTICRLSLYSPSSFHMLVGMERIATTRIETMGVSVKNGSITLRYNPEFAESLTEAERSFVLIHEMMHVLLHHCTHRSSSDRARHYKENVAMDLAVNTLIPEGSGVQIPRFKEDNEQHKAGDYMALLPKQFDFPERLSFEQYLSLLDDKYPNQSISFLVCGDGDVNDDNDMDGESVYRIDPNCQLGKDVGDRISNDHGDGYNEDPFVDDMIRNAVEHIERNHMWGNMGGESIELVKKAQEQPLRWGEILRFEAGNFVSFQREQTRRRWNKHYGKPFLGTTLRSVEPVAVYADTSASVQIDDLSRFVTEIERIAYYTGVYLWSFDWDIKDPDSMNVFNRRGINAIEFKGRGGTSFSPIFEHVKKKMIKKVVILTDGEAESIDPEQTDGLDVIWVITKGGCTQGKPGVVIQME